MTSWRGAGGLPARRPDQMYRPAGNGVTPGARSVVRARQVIISGSAAGIFIYSPVPGPGNLIGSWAGQQGADPYGNSYPEGIFVASGLIEGSLILSYGGVPAAGNLLASIADAAGTDSFGNAYLAGITSYGYS